MHSSNIDIKTIISELNILNVSDTNIDLESNISNDDLIMKNKSKKTIYFFILILFLCLNVPLIVTDLYYAYNDTSCVNQPAGQLSINLKDYLLVEGWIGVIVNGFILLILNYLFLKYDGLIDMTCILVISSICHMILTFFDIIWNIIGALIFWNLIDTSKCDKGIYNYVFTTLIIKLIFNFMKLLNVNNNKKHQN